MSKPSWNRLGERPLTGAEKAARHRAKKYAQYAGMPPIPCACGCGTLIPPVNKQSKPGKYAHGHNPSGIETRFTKGQPAWNKGIMGKASTSWKTGNGALPYGPEFTKIFKKMIRQRDGNKCQRCGTKRNKGRALEIHHIDFDKTNNDPTNLITLCGPCNIYFNYHIEESPKAFPKRRMLLQ